MLDGWMEFNVPFQYILDDKVAVVQW